MSNRDFTFTEEGLTVQSGYEIDFKNCEPPPLDCGDKARIGSGAYGDVYKVKYNKKWVALKVFKDPHGNTAIIKCPRCHYENGEYHDKCDKCPTSLLGETKTYLKEHELMEAVFVETKALTLVQHPNVGTLIGYTLKKPFCLVMELAERGCLFSILNKKEQKKDDYIDLPWSLRLWIALQIINGVAYIHSHHIIHRDLKGANILIREDWSVMLVDFGAAKFKDRPTRGSFVTGSVRWLAPELYEGIKTYAADIYSFAMVMYEILAREVPWKGESEEDVQADLAKGERPSISLTLTKSTPKGYIELMKECWNQDETKRPVSTKVLDTLKSIYEAQLEIEKRAPYTSSKLSYPGSFLSSLSSSSSSTMSDSSISTSSLPPISTLSISTTPTSSPSLSSTLTPPTPLSTRSQTSDSTSTNPS